MPDLWDRVKKTVTEIYATASERAVEGVNLGVKKLDEATLRRDLSREFAGLGGRTYQLLRRGEETAIAQDATIQGHLRRLEQLERQLEEKEREIHGLKGQGPTDTRSGGGN
jgi:predicted RNase H-like nuclease (RuvC/YqgF family)